MARDFIKIVVPAEKKKSAKANTLGYAEAPIIQNVLKKHRGNQSKAAQELGIHKTTLWRKMKKLGIDNVR